MAPSTVLAANSPRPQPATLTIVRGSEEEDGAIYRVEGGTFDMHELGWPVQLYVTLLDFGGDYADHGHRWCADLVAVSVAAATDFSIISAVKSSWGSDELLEIEDDKAFLVALDECLIDYGVKAPLVSKTSRRVNGPLRGCAQEAPAILTFPGIHLDRLVNAIGSTGWDFLSGRLREGESPKRCAMYSSTSSVLMDRINALIPHRYEDES